jgi:acyl carrier protein
MIVPDKLKSKLMFVLKNHYAFEDHEVSDRTMGRLVRELDVDSIAVLELFLVIEDAFELEEKLSSKINMGEAVDFTMKQFIDELVKQIYKIRRAQENPPQ